MGHNEDPIGPCVGLCLCLNAVPPGQSAGSGSLHLSNVWQCSVFTLFTVFTLQK